MKIPLIMCAEWRFVRELYMSSATTNTLYILKMASEMYWLGSKVKTALDDFTDACAAISGVGGWGRADAKDHVWYAVRAGMQ